MNTIVAVIEGRWIHLRWTVEMRLHRAALKSWPLMLVWTLLLLLLLMLMLLLLLVLVLVLMLMLRVKSCAVGLLLRRPSCSRHAHVVLGWILG